MTLFHTIAFYTAFFVVVAIIAFPRISLRKHPKLTSEEISSLRPELRALKVKYNAVVLIGCPIYVILIIAAGVQFGRPAFNELFLFFAGLLFIGIWDGLFASITGVFPATSRRNLNRFVYAPHEEHRRLAKLQIGLAVLGTLLCLAIFLFYPG